MKRKKRKEEKRRINKMTLFRSDYELKRPEDISIKKASELKIKDEGQPFFDLVKARILDFITEEVLFEPYIGDGIIINEVAIVKRIKDILERTIVDRFGGNSDTLGNKPDIEIMCMNRVEGEFMILFKRKEDSSIINSNIEFHQYLLEGFEKSKESRFFISIKRKKKG
jgi:hypothetical protein